MRRGRVGRASRKYVAEFYPYSSKRECDAVKRTAAAVLNAARGRGDIVAQCCEVCGKKKTEAHHDDYEKPLDVLWLCRFHHRVRDAELREQRRALAKSQRAAELPAGRLAVVWTPRGKPTRRSVVTANVTVALVRQATLEIAEALIRRDLPESYLARRMKVSRQVVNQQFSGGFRTLKVLSAYAEALDCTAVFVLRPKDAHQERLAS